MTHVLIVEDDTWQSEHIARQLERAGYRTQIAAHALEAIDKVDHSRPDVIVLDMMLPAANGMTLLHELRSHADLAHIPVIICSAESYSLKDLQPYGVVAVLDKTTMTNDDIVRTVRKAIG